MSKNKAFSGDWKESNSRLIHSLREFSDPCVVKITHIEVGHRGEFAWCRGYGGVVTVSLSKWKGEGSPNKADFFVLSDLRFHHSGTNLETGEAKAGWRAEHIRKYSLTDEKNVFLSTQKSLLIDFLSKMDLEKDKSSCEDLSDSD